MAQNQETEKGIEMSGVRENFVDSPNFVKIYSNNIQMTITLWDMSLMFGEIGETKDGKVTIEQKVKVNLSKEMTKALSNLLNRNLAAYESQFGEIKMLSTETFEKMVEGAGVGKSEILKPTKGKSS